ncbi:nuclear pore complex protein NUP1 isoform X2 [Vicia villosa]|uniref:nuclear pore complex protein NUP1 isoform X2 n=1 Tax=Vicia villosa TaxID=3911 RepID=UPI00273A7669|nr:nuclear pore complex protein NUP1 isoform X2 [Vicia villosa]
MDNSDQITPFPSTVPDERGAGGKLRKPPPRKPPASPYSRPSLTANRRWFSKLVDPAYRIIAGGATRFLPSLFSSTGEDQGEPENGEQRSEDNLLKTNSNLLPSELSKMASIGDDSSKLNSSFDIVLPRHAEKGELHENNRFSDIEQLLRGKKFTRDEFNHLVEVLNSRAVDVASVERGKEHTNLTSRQDDGGLLVAHTLPKVFNEQRHEESNGAMRGSSTPFMSKGRDEIGASPIDIARAYMGSRASEVGPSSKNKIQTVESTMLLNDETAIKSYDPSQSKRSPTCWPGAVVQDAYATPQSQGSKYGLLNHARTPYSRTLLMKSKSKDKSEVSASESGYGSIGPIRRTRHKVGVQSTSRRPAYSSLNSSQRENSSLVEFSSPIVATRIDPGGMSSTRKPLGFERSVPTVHTHTSFMAKKILEHIDRSIPTPKQKSDELKLATKWKNPDFSANTSTISSNEDNGSDKPKLISPSKYSELGGKNSTLRNEDEGNSTVDIQHRESTDKTLDIIKERTLASDLNVHSSIPILAKDARTTQNFGSSQMFSMKSTDKDVSMALPSGGGQYPSVVNQEKKTFANNATSKPVLAPISIKKPESKWTLASDNSSGFTFPVTASSSIFSEPPTPSMTPLLISTGNQHQSEENSTQLSYSFGIKKSNPAVVFSFPSTSNTVDDNAKYNFGSTDKARLQFSFGKTAVNC